MNNIHDPKLDSLIHRATQQQQALQIAVLAMTPQIYIGAQVLSALAHGLQKTEEAWRDETLPQEIVDKAIALTNLYLKTMG